MFSTIAIHPDGRLAQSWPAKFGDDDWSVIVDPKTRLHPDFERHVRMAASGRPDVDVFYGDHAVARGGGAFDPVLKPDFDRTQLLAQDYVAWPIVARGRLLRNMPSPEHAGTAATFEVLLHALSMDAGVMRIAQVLSVRPAPDRQATADDRQASLRRWLQTQHLDATLHPGRLPDTLEYRQTFHEFPQVTLVVPTRQEAGPDGPLIARFLESLEQTDWPKDRLSVLVGDDHADASAFDRAWPVAVERVATTRAPGTPFNYAAKMNRLWPLARTEHVVLMNDDLVVRNPGWLKALMTFATDAGVGGVGARLLYPDDRIQHAGMPLGVLGPCTHAFIGQAATGPSYGNWADVHREWSVVTGAVFATRRSLLELVNGFDERFALDFNDIDMCLKLRMLGYRIVYTPHAELTHLESASRGFGGNHGGTIARFYERWRPLMADDPAYNPGLTRTETAIRPVVEAQAWWG